MRFEADRDRRRHPPGDRHRASRKTGNRIDCAVYRSSGIDQQLAYRPVMTDGGYQGNPGAIMPFRKPRDGSDLPDWQEDLNATHRKIRARVEHTPARMKCWKILRDYRRAAHTLTDAVSGIAHLHNIVHASQVLSTRSGTVGNGPDTAQRQRVVGLGSPMDDPPPRRCRETARCRHGRGGHRVAHRASPAAVAAVRLDVRPGGAARPHRTRQRGARLRRPGRAEGNGWERSHESVVNTPRPVSGLDTVYDMSDPRSKRSPRIEWIAALFLANGAALLVYILAGVSLRWTAIALAVAALAVGVVVVRRMSPQRRRRFARRVRAGAIAAFAATLAYDAARYGLVEVAGMTIKPFETWRLFGLALTDVGQSPALVFAIGTAFHLTNGIGFGIAYTVAFGTRGPLAGIAFALVLETFMVSVYPGWLGLRALDEFLQVTIAGHVVYGATLGWLARSLLRRERGGHLDGDSPVTEDPGGSATRADPTTV
jgi:hypothetical protein